MPPSSQTVNPSFVITHEAYSHNNHLNDYPGYGIPNKTHYPPSNTTVSYSGYQRQYDTRNIQ